MQDEEINLLNACTDLVSLKKAEAFPRLLLATKQHGEWVAVRDLCLQTGIASGDFGPELFATWLSDPAAHGGYVVILFYDDESKWSMSAHYNRERLVGGASPTQAPQSGVPMTRPSRTTAPQAAPASEH